MIFRWNKTPPVLKVGKQLRKTSTCGLHNSTYAGRHARAHTHTHRAGNCSPTASPTDGHTLKALSPPETLLREGLAAMSWVEETAGSWGLCFHQWINPLADSELTTEKWRKLWKVGSSWRTQLTGVSLLGGHLALLLSSQPLAFLRWGASAPAHTTVTMLCLCTAEMDSSDLKPLPLS